MKLLLAPDKFKGSLSAHQACDAIERGARRALGDVDIDRCPLADGGEGTIDALLDAVGGEVHETRVRGPLGERTDARWARLSDGQTAVIEVAEALGLALVPETQRDPLRSTSYGVGELIRAALDSGARRIVVGLGGSATSDGGAGMAQALGVRFEGAPEPIRAIDLCELVAIDGARIDPRLDAVEVIAASDVDNPLLGMDGAARVYAPQKGASVEDVRVLERALGRLASLTAAADAALPGSGAAGGLGFGLCSFAGARIAAGADLVLDAVRFDERALGVDLVITGEGRFDAQSLRGKATIAVARRARRAGVPVVALVGAIAEDVGDAAGRELDAVLSIAQRPMPLALALRDADRLLGDLGEQVVRLCAALKLRS